MNNKIYKEIAGKKKLVILFIISDCDIFKQLQMIINPEVLGVVNKKWCRFVKKIPDLLFYISDLKVNELLNTDFMWSILKTLREEGVRKLIADTMKKINRIWSIFIMIFFNSPILAPNTNRSNHI